MTRLAIWNRCLYRIHHARSSPSFSTSSLHLRWSIEIPILEHHRCDGNMSSSKSLNLLPRLSLPIISSTGSVSRFFVTSNPNTWHWRSSFSRFSAVLYPVHFSCSAVSSDASQPHEWDKDIQLAPGYALIGCRVYRFFNERMPWTRFHESSGFTW